MPPHAPTLPLHPVADSPAPPLRSNHSPRPVPSVRSDRRGRTGRVLRYLAVAGVVVGVGWAIVRWVVPSAKSADVVTATATVGELVIVVTDKGELESAQSVQGVCEMEGGGKLVTIVPEGTQVKKGEVVARFDSDTLLRGVNE